MHPRSGSAARIQVSLRAYTRPDQPQDLNSTDTPGRIRLDRLRHPDRAYIRHSLSARSTAGAIPATRPKQRTPPVSPLPSCPSSLQRASGACSLLASALIEAVVPVGRRRRPHVPTNATDRRCARCFLSPKGSHQPGSRARRCFAWHCERVARCVGVVALDDREQRVCRQGRDDRYAWPSDSRVIEVAASLGTARAHATRDCACSESAAQQTWRAVAIADIQACGHEARHDCFGSRGCSGPRYAFATEGSARADRRWRSLRRFTPPAPDARLQRIALGGSPRLVGAS